MSRRIVAIAAYARNRAIGDHGQMPWRIPEDLAHFKHETLGHALIMGRVTYDAIGRPLPGRRNIVVTRDPEWTVAGVEVAHSLDEAMARVDPESDIVIGGGAQIYAQAMPILTHQILTEVDLEVAGDAFYPAFSLEDWCQTRREPGPGCEWVWWERC